MQPHLPPNLPRAIPAPLRRLSEAVRRLEDGLDAARTDARTLARLERIHMEIDALASRMTAAEARVAVNA